MKHSKSVAFRHIRPFPPLTVPSRTRSRNVFNCYIHSPPELVLNSSGEPEALTVLSLMNNNNKNNSNKKKWMRLFHVTFSFFFSFLFLFSSSSLSLSLSLSHSLYPSIYPSIYLPFFPFHFTTFKFPPLLHSTLLFGERESRIRLLWFFHYALIYA